MANLSTKKPTISVIGLGKLGSPMAACFASRGFSVIGVDLNSQFVNKLSVGVAPVNEPGLAALLDEYSNNIKATTDTFEATLASDISFVIVPTPSDSSGAFSATYVVAAAESIGKAIGQKNSFHLVVIVSTLMPGQTATEVLPVLENTSGKKCGQDFGLCYSPEFIALGSVIKDLLYPDFILIGQSDPKSGEILRQTYSAICANEPPFACMNFINAEITKIAVNTFVTTKISYANMLSEVCQQLPNADVNVVTSALGLDSRIGNKYLKGATAYGGPCFPRDNQAFSVLARKHGIEPTLAAATDEINKRQLARVMKTIQPFIKDDSTVGILGITYKSNTAVIEDSMGLSLAKALMHSGISTIVYDSRADSIFITKSDIRFVQSMAQVLDEADIIVITLPDDEFKLIEPEKLQMTQNGRKTILDCWRILPSEKFSQVCNYLCLGLGDKNIVVDNHNKVLLNSI